MGIQAVTNLRRVNKSSFVYWYWCRSSFFLLLSRGFLIDHTHRNAVWKKNTFWSLRTIEPKSQPHPLLFQLLYPSHTCLHLRLLFSRHLPSIVDLTMSFRSLRWWHGLFGSDAIAVCLDAQLKAFSKGVVNEMDGFLQLRFALLLKVSKYFEDHWIVKQLWMVIKHLWMINGK